MASEGSAGHPTPTFRQRLRGGLQEEAASTSLPIWLGFFALWGGLNAGFGSLTNLGTGSALGLRALAPLAVLYAAAVIVLAAWHKHGSLRVPVSLKLLVLYGAVGLVSGALLSPDPAQAIYWAAAFLAVPLGYAAVLELSPVAANVPKRLLDGTWLIAGGITSALVAVAFVTMDPVQALAAGELPRFNQYVQPVHPVLRINSNGAGRFAAVFGLVGLSRLLDSGKGWLRRGAWVPLLAAVAFFLVLAQSRSTLAGLAVAVPLLLVLRLGWREGVLSVLGGSVLFVLSGGAEILLRRIVLRAGWANLGTVSGRAEIWSQVGAAAAGSPLVGWGFHGDRLVAGHHAHDAWLHALAQAGFIGLMLFILAWIAAWVGVWRLDVLRRFPGINGPRRTSLIEATAVLAFLTVRTIPESTAAFYGVDLLILVPVLGYIAWMAKHRTGAPKEAVDEPTG